MASLLVNDNINPDNNNNTQLSYIIQIKLKTNKMNIPIIPNVTTLKQLQTNLEEKTGIEIVNQKLLLKGKQLQNVLSADQFLYDINVDKKQVNFVSVLVNPNDEILEKIKDLNFDYYQLYDVSPERTKEIKL